MKRKILTIFFIFFIFTSFLFCFNAKKVTAEKKTVVFWTLQLSVFDEYINEIISEFENKNPDIKIKWIDVPYSEGEKRTLASVLTDNPPDLVNLTPEFSFLLAQKSALLDIQSENLSQFLPSLLQSLKYNDKYFGIPFYATSPVTLYNTELTNKLHLNKIPENYDELFAIKPQKFYISMFNFSENDTLLKLLNKYNINSFENINSQKSIELFKTLKTLYNNGFFPKESITQTHRESLEKYMSGQIAFLVTGANFINMIKENAPSIYKKTNVSTQLTGDTKLFDYSLMNFVIPKKSKYPNEALKFALFFTNEENQLKFAKLTTILPVNKFALQNSYFSENKENDLQSQARIISAKQLSNLQPPVKNVKNKKDLNVLSSDCIQNILLNNSDIKSTLDNFSQDWQKL